MEWSTLRKRQKDGFFKFCRQGKIPKYLKKNSSFNGWFGKLLIVLKFCQTLPGHSNCTKRYILLKAFFLPIILYWFKRIVEFYELDAKQQKKYHFRSSDLMCKEKIVEFELRYSIHVKGISRKQADYNGKKLIWLLVSVGKSKIWPKNGLFFCRETKMFFVPCTDYEQIPVKYFLGISIGPMIQLSTSPWIGQG